MHATSLAAARPPDACMRMHALKHVAVPCAMQRLKQFKPVPLGGIGPRPSRAMRRVEASAARRRALVLAPSQPPRWSRSSAVDDEHYRCG